MYLNGLIIKKVIHFRLDKGLAFSFFSPQQLIVSLNKMLENCGKNAGNNNTKGKE